MIQLSSFPAGLLDLVGAQNFGVAPKALADTISPTIELFEPYLISKQRIEVVPAAGTFAVVGGTNPNNSFLVPAGEVWRVFGFSFGIQTAVGESLSYTPMVLLNGIGMALDSTVAQAASTYRFGVAKNIPIWLPAGGRLCCFAQEVVGAPAATMTALVARLRV